MSDDKLLCPVCGKHRFGQYSNNEICKYCGWENDDYYESGGANTLSLEEFKLRYQKYIELNPRYIWVHDGYPEITEKDEYQLAHKYCYSYCNLRAFCESDIVYEAVKQRKASNISRFYSLKSGQIMI